MILYTDLCYFGPESSEFKLPVVTVKGAAPDSDTYFIFRNIAAALGWSNEFVKAHYLADSEATEDDIISFTTSDGMSEVDGFNTKYASDFITALGDALPDNRAFSEFVFYIAASFYRHEESVAEEPISASTQATTTAEQLNRVEQLENDVAKWRTKFGDAKRENAGLTMQLKEEKERNKDAIVFKRADIKPHGISHRTLEQLRATHFNFVPIEGLRNILDYYGLTRIQSAGGFGMVAPSYTNDETEVTKVLDQFLMDVQIQGSQHGTLCMNHEAWFGVVMWVEERYKAKVRGLMM